MDTQNLHFETKQIHGGLHSNETGSRGIAIYPSAAYEFKTCQYAANLFELSEAGNIYSRLNNPTVASYEERIALLYGGTAAVATSSGMSAVMAVVASLADAGDNIVVSPYLYGGTYNLFRVSLRKLGIDVRIARSLDVDDFRALADGRTRMLYVESMGNPTCIVPDLAALGKLARELDVPFVVDNTFGAGGYLCNPFEYGANIVVDSATKWINGHGTAMGGIIIDGGNYDWGNGKFPQIDGPSEGYHGLNLYKTFGNAAFAVKCRVDGLRDFGACPSPFDAYLMLIGLETLSLRMDYQLASTKKLAEWCASNDKIESVDYVGFPSHPGYANAQKYFRQGGSAVFSMTLAGSLESTVRFVEALQLAKHMTMVGDSVTVVTHPASTTHKQLSDADKRAAGVTPTLLRVSVGLENVEDIIGDFQQALDHV